MYCGKCKGKVNSNDKFCTNCGSELKHNAIVENSEISQCPRCKSKIHNDDDFCPNCGYTLKEDSVSYISENNIKQRKVEKENTENIDFKEEVKNIFNSTTKSIGKFAGNDERLNVNLKDLFSEVFKSHSKEESDEVFIAGTKKTTPRLSDVSEEWGRPWVFSRVFLALFLTFIILWILVNNFENSNAIPGLIFIGALTVPISGLMFFFETNAFKNISIFDVLKMFFIGGVLSLLSTLVLYNFISFSEEYYTNGKLTVLDAMMIGLVEETGKAIIIIIFINNYKTNKILNGLLIGAAIGSGFAVFESAGYIFNISLSGADSIMDIILIRSWTGLGGHLVWSAIIGAAVVISKENMNFKFSNIIDKRFAFFFIMSVILHGIWDTSFSVLQNDNLKYVILIGITWLFIFILISAGLKQVNVLRQNEKHRESNVV